MRKIFDYISKTREYLDYLEEHINNVQKAWKELQIKCKDMNFIYDDYLYKQIDMEIEYHDLSKLSEEEFIQYRKVFFPVNSADIGNLSSAWNHHKENNPHHWENWTLNEYFYPNQWVIHCVHMIIDWIAMGYKMGDTAQIYYENNKNKIKLPEYAIKFIYEIFNRLDK